MALRNLQIVGPPVIGLKGLAGAGKTEVRTHLEELLPGYTGLDVSAVVIEAYNQAHPDRPILTEEDKRVRRKEDITPFSTAMTNQNRLCWWEFIHQKPGPKIVAGLRRTWDIDEVHRCNGIVITIDASAKIRRLRLGNEAYKKAMHDPMERELQNYLVPGLGRGHHYTIPNHTQDKEVLRAQVERLIKHLYATGILKEVETNSRLRATVRRFDLDFPRLQLA